MVLRIGTRGSELAMVQANLVRSLLCDVCGLESGDIEIIAITTSGDSDSDSALSDFTGKGFFTSEIESALLSDSIDIAVHSTKDMSTVLPDGLSLTCFLPREDPRDAFISSTASDISTLAKNSIIGTSSPRRSALLRRLRPDITIASFRGNVPTRLDKLSSGSVDATILAAAGLHRLGLSSSITSYLDPSIFPPSACQGIIGIETRTGDSEYESLVSSINDFSSHLESCAERSFLQSLGASCRSPIAGLARHTGSTLTFHGMILSRCGVHIYEWRGDSDATLSCATDLGRRCADEILALCGAQFFTDWTRGNNDATIISA